MSRYISKVSIENYKCFRDVAVNLSPGINVVLGKNNSGKTTLLEVLAFSGEQCQPFDATIGPTIARFELSLSDSQYFIKNVGIHDLPCPTREFAQDNSLNTDQEFLDWLVAQPTLLFQASHNIDQNQLAISFPSIKSYLPELTADDRYNCLDWRPVNGRLLTAGGSSQKRPDSDFGLEEFVRRRKNTFFFRPDRIVPMASELSIDGLLNMDGSNLGGVLFHLQSRSKLIEYLGLVQQVFPEIKSITSNAATPTSVEAFLWPVAGKADKSISLRKSGRGIAPVLAVLYLLFVSSNEHCTIIIDEPQAFLHPSALRRLLSLLKGYPQHQFILSTHSPIVIAAAGVEHCIVVRQNEGQSTLESVRQQGNANIAQQILAEVGASLQDVFGAEGVVWVEGPTESYCFNEILKADASLDSKGIAILPLRATGDLVGKHRDAIAEIYRRLSTSNALMPTAIAFQFDREETDQNQREQLKTRIGVPVFFTGRRMYENYLLHPGALAALLNLEDQTRGSPATEIEVRNWLDKEREGWQERRKSKVAQEWIEDAHGADILKKLFGKFTDNRCEYRKVRHGPFLTNWLLKNEPLALRELQCLLGKILETI